ncbi:hypothetical protein D9M68_970780 [compost metagenome]
MPVELADLIAQIGAWTGASEGGVSESRPVADAVLGGRFAQAAYRMQLLPLLGDAQARTLRGQTGELARLPWNVQLEPVVQRVDDEQVAAISVGLLQPDTERDPHD